MTFLLPVGGWSDCKYIGLKFYEKDIDYYIVEKIVI